MLLPGTTFRQLVANGMSKATASRAIKRGWYAPDYHRKHQPGMAADFQPKPAYEIAEAVFYRHFWPAHWWLKDDLIQEAVLRQCELSGDPNCHPGIMYGAAKNAMRNHIAKWRSWHHFEHFLVGEEHETAFSPDT